MACQSWPQLDQHWPHLLPNISHVVASHEIPSGHLSRGWRNEQYIQLNNCFLCILSPPPLHYPGVSFGIIKTRPITMIRLPSDLNHLGANCGRFERWPTSRESVWDSFKNDHQPSLTVCPALCCLPSSSRDYCTTQRRDPRVRPEDLSQSRQHRLAGVRRARRVLGQLPFGLRNLP